jgi:hypothetical protein
MVDNSLNDEGTFDGVSYYKCKHCDRGYTCDAFTEEGKLFESKFNNLSSKLKIKNIIFFYIFIYSFLYIIIPIIYYLQYSEYSYSMGVIIFPS